MNIHRCRFVPLPPSTINVLAFSHSYLSKNQNVSSPRLAIGRANGDIEIWNPLKGYWLQEIIIHGGKDRSIDGLVWIQEPNTEDEGRFIIGRPRLFSIGYTTTVTEWDITTAKPLKQVSGNHGEIWCLAAQPSVSSPGQATNGQNDGKSYGQRLIAGCTDGALVLYSTQDGDLQLQKLLVRPSSKKAKIISITFQNRNIVIAGCTDSTIRIYDIRSGNLIRAMTLGSGPKGGPKDIIVWSVKVLRDGTIISGDSTGELKIWDGELYTLRQRILAHKQDILCLTTNINGTLIFSGGMDRRTVLYKPVNKAKSRWIEAAHRRFHSHDVRAMASFEGPDMSVFVSGGHDASPIVVPMKRFGSENHRALPFLSQDLVVQSAPKARLIICWWEREIWIWRIENFSTQIDEESSNELSEGRKLVSKIYIKGDANITSAAISIEGNILAVATISEVKLFHLRPPPNLDRKGLQITTIKAPPGSSYGARLLTFSPDGKWLCIVRPENQVYLARIVQSSESITFSSHITRLKRLDRQIDKLVLFGGLGTYPQTITQIAFSSNSRILVFGDLAGYIDSYILLGDEDLSVEKKPRKSLSDLESESDSDIFSEDESEKIPDIIFGQYWRENPRAKSIPQVPASPVVLSFRPSYVPDTMIDDLKKPLIVNSSSESHGVEDRLLVITAAGKFYEFEVLEGRLSDWSRRNPPNVFPEKYRKLLETVKGVIWDISPARERVWLYSVGWLWMFDLGRDFDHKRNDEHNNCLKRKRGSCGAGGESKISELKIVIDDTPMVLEQGESCLAFNDLSHEVKKNGLHEDQEISQVSNHQRQSNSKLEVDNADDSTKSSEHLLETKRPARKTVAIPYNNSSYHTFKYRPIVGVVALDNKTTTARPEVVLLERPIWEAELPPRYYGEQEWRSWEIDS